MDIDFGMDFAICEPRKHTKEDRDFWNQKAKDIAEGNAVARTLHSQVCGGGGIFSDSKEDNSSSIQDDQCDEEALKSVKSGYFT